MIIVSLPQTQTSLLFYSLNCQGKPVKFMEVKSPVHDAKSQKLGEEWENGLGKLSDKILQHILSFLPTKDAVRTSTLSKRWKYLWTSIINLEFQEGQSKNRTHFMNFVERVLLLRDNSNIMKFSLECDVLLDASRINAWISSAVRHNVEEMSLSLLDLGEHFVLPISLFTCDSIRNLKLCMIYILELPSFIHFSNLKSLNLSYVAFPDSHSAQKLFSGCPVLKELNLCNCRWDNDTSFCISAPMLTTLFIHGEQRNDSIGCEVVIYGTHIAGFIYSGELTVDYRLCDFPSLAVACVVLDTKGSEDDAKRKETARRADKFLRGLSNVRGLILSGETVEVLSCMEEFICNTPVFNNLNYLQYIKPPVNFYNEAVLRIFQNSPSLNFLEFKGGLQKEISEKDDWILDPVPLCFLSKLKDITVSDFYGTQAELQVVKILLKNAMVSEKMTICCNTDVFDRIGVSNKQEVQDELLKFPRGSVKCDIKFL